MSVYVSAPELHWYGVMFFYLWLYRWPEVIGLVILLAVAFWPRKRT